MFLPKGHGLWMFLGSLPTSQVSDGVATPDVAMRLCPKQGVCFVLVFLVLLYKVIFGNFGPYYFRPCRDDDVFFPRVLKQIL